MALKTKRCHQWPTFGRDLIGEINTLSSVILSSPQSEILQFLFLSSLDNSMIHLGSNHFRNLGRICTIDLLICPWHVNCLLATLELGLLYGLP